MSLSFNENCSEEGWTLRGKVGDGEGQGIFTGDRTEGFGIKSTRTKLTLYLT